VFDFVPRLASMTQNLITGMLVHSQAEAPPRRVSNTLNLPSPAGLLTRLVVLGRLSRAL
jgi:hypothetical protein